MSKKTRRNFQISHNRAIGLACAALIGLYTPVLMPPPVAADHKSAPMRPGLVVGIMVEGLNEDYLHLLYDYFVDDGFKRLMENGVTISNIDYGPEIDPTAAAAIIYTGASPSVNGIPSKDIYNVERRFGSDVLLDETTLGNFTDETYSPRAIKVSTLADEIRLDADGVGGVYSIVPNHQQSIISAGHAGNSAVWITDHTGKWATTTYYKDLPSPVVMRNYQAPLTAVIDTASWSPSMELSFYPDVPEYRRPYPFRHTFGRKDVDRYKAFKSSPVANREVTSLAIEYIENLQLGKRGVMDLLNLGYDLDPFAYGKLPDNRVETMDSYLRLDRDLSRLFKAIDTRVGSDKALIYVVGLPSQPSYKLEDEKWAIPTGQFSTRKAMALLNAYLIGLYGNGEWINGFHNGNFYLNTPLIRERGLDVVIVRSEAATFLAKMSGISEVYTIDDIIAGRAGDNGVALRRNTDAASAGDLIIRVTPGWEVLDDAMGGPSRVANETFSPSPAFILWPPLEPTQIEETVDARVLAPSLARLLRIRSPNAASLPALRFKQR